MGFTIRIIVPTIRFDKNISYAKILSKPQHLNAAALTGLLQNVINVKSVAALYINRRSSNLKIRASEA